MLGSHANQTVSAFMASLDGDGIVYCNSSSLNFHRKKDVYQPLFTDNKYHSGLRRFSIPCVRVTSNDRIAAKADIQRTDHGALGTRHRLGKPRPYFEREFRESQPYDLLIDHYQCSTPLKNVGFVNCRWIPVFVQAWCAIFSVF